MSFATDLALSLDPTLLAHKAGMIPDPWQADILRSDAQQIALLCSRQSGKSTTTSFIALHRALFHPASLILLLAPALRQSQELFRKLKVAYSPISQTVPLVEESALRLEFANESRIVCLPGSEKTIRGFSGASLLIVDEAARVKDALYQSIRPMLAVSKGKLILLSTPFGKRGFFHHEWDKGGTAWHRSKMTAYDCPRISPEWLEAERRSIGDWWFRQEYLCEFVDSVHSVFRYEDMQRALDSTVAPLFPQEQSRWNISNTRVLTPLPTL